MAFSLRQVRYFVAIAETGSVSGAARQLSISQSTITEAIQELEHDLGFKLVERSPHGMSLTLKGYQFLRHAEKILGEVSNARRALHENGAPSEGRLQLGVTPLVAGYILADLLARFRRAFPFLDVAVVEDARDYLEHLLIGGELDIAVMVLPPRATLVSLEAELVEASRYRLWLPLGHHLAEATEISLRELAEEPQILLAIDEIDEAPKRVWQQLSIRPPIAFRTRSVEAVRSLVATGAGLAVLPDLTYRQWSLEGDKIEARRIREDLPAVSVGVVWRRGSRLSPIASQFLSVVQTYRSIRQRG
ncbi:LysR substrate-binding domain-containing protein [Microvirga alba]|uniref:LysR family transcriptional regulator n=1 Tax=Microvirga alba TaxID=2791025 RepID=A0A931BQR6_9HYPH|nr:LysR substrate-binding domain-containing protein [Microvirga alba]MBF9233934.1 LysR family transcriptional regulator [Microvirga alba]